MTIRELVLSNPKDLIREFELMNLSPPDSQTIQKLQTGLNFKVSECPANAVLSLRELITEAEGLLFTPEHPNSLVEILISLSPWHLTNLIEKLQQPRQNFIPELGNRLEQIIAARRSRPFELTIGGKKISLNPPVIMGILNVTPDSFSDGGLYFAPEKAYRHAVQMADAGAEIIDIGGESTRPGAAEIPLEEEWNRISPVLKRLVKLNGMIVSIDTYKSEIARRALDLGAHVVNDISGFTFDERMIEIIAGFQATAVCMHIKGTPRNMQANPNYYDLTGEIFGFLKKQTQMAETAGVRSLIIDPGIGFGKRLQDNFEIIRRLREFRSLGYPVLVGPSRKSFIGKSLNLPPEDRLSGTVTAVISCVWNGADILRVHDVTEINQSLKILLSGIIKKFDVNSLKI